MSGAAVKPVVSVDYRAITNTNPLKPGFDTTLIFDVSKKSSGVSPIDEFITNNNEINKIWLGPVEPSPELASLVLLGYVSAVESYMRALFRELIHIDFSCRRHLSSSQISFSAAMNHERINMPDALLEATTFIGTDSIKKAVTKFLDLAKPFPGMDKHFEEFEKICQLRHCCTHRFGKLGAKNAAILGMSAHNKFLERPLKLTSAALSDVAEILRTFVKSFNNDIFGKIMERTVAEQLNESIPSIDKVMWKWNYASDKPVFEKYYKLFASKNDSIRSKSCKSTYDAFVATLKPVPKSAAAKAKAAGNPGATKGLAPSPIPTPSPALAPAAVTGAATLPVASPAVAATVGQGVTFTVQAAGAKKSDEKK
jgi:hypothetical protein